MARKLVDLTFKLNVVLTTLTDITAGPVIQRMRGL